MRMRTIKIQIFYGKTLSANLRHRVKTGARLRDGILHGVKIGARLRDDILHRVKIGARLRDGILHRVKTGRGFAMTQLHHAAKPLFVADYSIRTIIHQKTPVDGSLAARSQSDSS